MSHGKPFGQHAPFPLPNGCLIDAVAEKHVFGLRISRQLFVERYAFPLNKATVDREPITHGPFGFRIADNRPRIARLHAGQDLPASKWHKSVRKQ